VLHEAVELDSIVQRGSAAGQIDRLDDVAQSGSLVGIAHADGLSEAVSRPGPTAHCERLNAAQWLGPAHCSDSLLREPTRSRRTRAP
jgi:hypothetical protein